MQLFYPLGLPSENIGIHKYHDTTKNQSYVPITGCILSHILSSKELSSLEKMYYILADSLSCINSSKGRNRSISLPAKSWANRLSCSKSEVFVLQKSLEDQGYFIIYRDKNDKGQNNRNTITTTIPTQVFNDLKYEPDRFNLGDINNTTIHHSKSDSLDVIDRTYIPTLEGKRQHLEKTKMFIRVPYEFLKQLNSNCSISATSKIVLLYLFTKIYKSSVNKYDPDDVLTHNQHSIVTSYQELQKELKLHRNSISKALKDLEDNNLISKEWFFVKDTADYNGRASKSLWKISILNAPLITNNNNQHEQKDQQQQAVISNYNEVGYNNNKALASSKEWGCTKYDPPCTDSGQLYNKDFILKNSIIKDIDYIDANHLDSRNLSVNNSSDTLDELPKTKNLEKNYKEELFENEQSSFSSKSYNNFSFLNDSYVDSTNSQKKHSKTAGLKQSCFNTRSEDDTRAIKDISVEEVEERWVTKFAGQKPKADAKSTLKKTESQKELRHFYPLLKKDVGTLNFRSNREFSVNFVNQLLLKLYIKYPEKRFKNKFTFLSYMEKILANEKHQGPLVNHTTFRFSCNIGADEKTLLEYEKYLSEIENSFDTSKEMRVRKKIAGRFESGIAYQLLTAGILEYEDVENTITDVLESSESPQSLERGGEAREAEEGLERGLFYIKLPSHLSLTAKQQETLENVITSVYGHTDITYEQVQNYHKNIMD